MNTLQQTPSDVPKQPFKRFLTKRAPMTNSYIRIKPQYVKENKIEQPRELDTDTTQETIIDRNSVDSCSIQETPPISTFVEKPNNEIEVPEIPHELPSGSNNNLKSLSTDWTTNVSYHGRLYYNKPKSSTPNRKKINMADLIFANPSDNPMQKNISIDEECSGNKSEEEPIDDSDEEPKCLPTPRVKIDEDGEIVIDEASLVVENTFYKKKQRVTRRKKIPHGKAWTNDETLLFYKALNTVGTDFTSMDRIFPDRTRKELKAKFKKEDKINASLIDTVLNEPAEFNATNFQDFIENRKLEAKIMVEKTRRTQEKVIVPTNMLASSGLSFLKRGSKGKIDKTYKINDRKCQHSSLYNKLKKGFTVILEDRNNS